MTDKARSPSPSRRPYIPNRRTRVSDLSSFITRTLMLRALRSAGMQHMLFGAPGSVAVVPPRDEDAEEFAKCARRMIRRSPVQFPDLKLQVYNATGGTSMERIAAEGITVLPQVVVVARKGSMSLRALTAGADATLWLPSPDADLVGTALKMVHGRSPVRRDLEMIATLPISLNGRPPGPQAAPPLHPHPELVEGPGRRASASDTPSASSTSSASGAGRAQRPARWRSA